MKNMFAKPSLKRFSGALLLIGALGLSSCGEEETPPAAPNADFEYELNNLEVTLTNKSTNATSYSWDFGDGESSTDENPVHTYAEFGVYEVKLTATSEGGSDTSTDEITVAKDSPVTIDGSFDDWDEVPVASSSVDGNGGSIHEMKVDYDALNIYVLLKGDMKGVYGIFINSDNDGTTGATSPNFDYLWGSLGADYYIEGNLVDWGSLQKDDPANPDWKFDVQTDVIADVVETAPVADVDGEKVFEFAIKRSSIPNMSSEQIGIAIKDIDIDAGWTTSGALPPVSVEGTPGVVYTLDFTK